MKHSLKVYWRTWLRRYVHKMRGLTVSNARPQLGEAGITFVCCFIGVGVMGWLVDSFVGGMEGIMLIPSFGASSLMIFGTPHSPFAQPRNVVGGHVISALAGVFAFGLFGPGWLAAAMAVATAGALMHICSVMHPPGGATALLAVIGDPRVHEQGYSFAFMPVGVGAALLVLMAVLINNAVLHRQYPTHWR